MGEGRAPRELSGDCPLPLVWMQFAVKAVGLTEKAEEGPRQV